VAVLLWLYFSALILLLGAEFTQVYARRRGVRIRPALHARRVRLVPVEVDDEGRQVSESAKHCSPAKVNGKGPP
jgi:membrane protein